MDPNLRREIDAFLHDLWEGTDLEIALRKAELAIVRFKDEELTPIDVEKALGRYKDAVLAEIRAEEIVMAREKWSDEPFEAVPFERIAEVMEAQLEGDSD